MQTTYVFGEINFNPIENVCKRERQRRFGMKTVPLLLAAVMTFLLLGAGAAMAQQDQPTPPPQAPSGEGWFCPWCGRGPEYGPEYEPGMPYGYGRGPGMHRGYGYGRGPGMHRGYGYGHGPGMMHRGYGPGRGYGYRPEQYGQQQRQFNKDEAESMVENYLRSSRNPNLKVGEVKEEDDHYEVNIVTKDGSLVDKFMVDKSTGWMRSIY